MKIPVKIKDYKSYIESNGTAYLCKNYLLVADSPKRYITDRIFGQTNEKIFNGIETIYNYSKNNDDYLILFKTNSDNEYRMDLLKEANTNIYHVAFSLSSSVTSDYSDSTNKGEPIEVFNRLIWILKDFEHNIVVDEFCIGGTGTPRDNIYRYMMTQVSWWEKRECDEYDLGWAIYFKL